MNPAVALNLFVSTGGQNVQRVVDDTETRVLSNPQRTLVEATTGQQWHQGLWLVNAYVFCPSATDADSLYQSIIDGWTTGPENGRIRVGSWVKRINSFEDEGLADVVVSTASKT